MADKKKKADTIDTRQLPPTPPNGGWGWAVVAASFFSNFVIDGVLYTFGIFLPDLVSHFESTPGAISLIGSVLGGTYLIVGPVVSALVNRFGCRPVTICGSIISATAFFVSTYSNSIHVLMITYGVFGGIGFGMMYLPSIVVVGLYFDTKRAMATGIAVCGSGLGTFVFAPLAHALLDEYSWRGANKVMAGLVLNGIACGLIYLPIRDKIKPPAPVERLAEEEEEEEEKVLASEIIPSISVQDMRKTSLSETNSGRGTPQRKTDSPTPPLPYIVRKDVFYGGSVQNLAEYKATGSMTSYMNSVSNIPSGDELQEKEDAKKRGCCSRFVGFITSIFDFSLLLSPTFLVVCLSGICGFIGFFSPYMYLVDFAQKQGVAPGTASFLISVIGLCNIFSRVGAGWLADRPWADSLVIHNVAAIIAGVSTMLLPVLLVPPLMFAYAICFGTSLSAFITLRSIVLCDLLGVEKLTNSFGLCALFQGIALLAGTPLAGNLFEKTNSYTATFLVAGSILALGGVVCLPARRIARWEENRNKRKAEQRDQEAGRRTKPQSHSNNNNSVSAGQHNL